LRGKGEFREKQEEELEGGKVCQKGGQRKGEGTRFKKKKPSEGTLE